MIKATVPQAVRYSFLLIELAALVVANRVAFGVWLPTSDPAGLWFYAALFGLLLGQRLNTPFFTSPKDAVLYAIPTLVAVLQIPDSAWATDARWGAVSHILLLVWTSLVIVAASLALWFQNFEGTVAVRVSGVAAQLSSSAGGPIAFFSVVLFLVLLAFQPTTVEGLLVIVVAWALTGPFSLMDYLYGLSRRIRRVLATGFDAVAVGIVAAYQVPGLVVIRTQREAEFPPGSTVAFRDATGDLHVAGVVGSAGKDSGPLTRSVELGFVKKSSAAQLAYIDNMQAMVVSEDCLTPDQQQRSVNLRINCIGFVAPESEIGKLIVEVVATKDLAAGRLVQARCGAEDVFYQLTNGLTKEEVVQHKNTFGFVAAQARTVGVWDAGNSRFKPVSWVPAPNSPVFLVETKSSEFDASRIGTFPGSDMSVGLRSVDYLVTHNTAILGILGVGKSTLSMELVERVLRGGSKVIVLDLTDQYASELVDLYDFENNENSISKLQAACVNGKTNVKKNVEEGGSRNEFSSAVAGLVVEFMKSEHDLLILNPAVFEVWKQDSKPFGDTASMASLTACELTHIFSDAALRAVQPMGRTDKARLLMVYEEAHSLVPEWNATVGDGDRAASNGTARAILQGRKYGLGCLLITQRTASVTKTILNQCNSIFAMRSFDDTGREFLANYIGREYAGLLPSLPERNAIFFGRASSSENPIQVKLNDREEFLNSFRVKAVAPERAAG
jgi:uncharacterized protein